MRLFGDVLFIDVTFGITMYGFKTVVISIVDCEGIYYIPSIPTTHSPASFASISITYISSNPTTPHPDGVHTCSKQLLLRRLIDRSIDSIPSMINQSHHIQPCVFHNNLHDIHVCNVSMMNIFHVVSLYMMPVNRTRARNM